MPLTNTATVIYSSVLPQQRPLLHRYSTRYLPYLQRFQVRVRLADPLRARTRENAP